MGSWNDLLPECVAVAGEEHAIRSDFRAMLDICAELSDPELSEQERGEVILYIFYPELEKFRTAPEIGNSAEFKLFRQKRRRQSVANFALKISANVRIFFQTWKFISV